MLEHKEAISPDQNDPLHEILDDLGEVPDVASLLGNVGIHVHYAPSSLQSSTLVEERGFSVCV